MPEVSILYKNFWSKEVDADIFEELDELLLRSAAVEDEVEMTVPWTMILEQSYENLHLSSEVFRVL